MNEWKSIDSAPRNGSIIIGIEKGQICLIYYGMGDWHEYHIYGEMCYEVNPEFWMPLPDLPSIGFKRLAANQNIDPEYVNMIGGVSDDLIGSYDCKCKDKHDK